MGRDGVNRDKERRIRRKAVCILLGIILLVILFGQREQKPKMEEKPGISREEAEYLTGVFEQALAERKEKEQDEDRDRKVSEAVSKLLSMEGESREAFLDAYIEKAEDCGLGDVIYEKEIQPLACQGKYVRSPQGTFWVERAGEETDAWMGTEVWESIRFRRLLGIVFRSEKAVEPYAEDALDMTQEAGVREHLVAWHIPQKEMELQNVWVTENGENAISCFLENVSFTVEKNAGQTAGREVVANLSFTDGKLTGIREKKEKITGKLIRIRGKEAEIEGQGTFPVAEGFQGYRLYGKLISQRLSEIPIGTDYADYVLEDGKICAVLLTREENMEKIRVLLRTDGYAGIYHEKIEVSSQGRCLVEWAGGKEELAAGEKLVLTPESEWFWKGERVKISPMARTDRLCIENLRRSQGVPSYHGSLEIVKEEEGFYVINEVPLEEYLYAVVPSEMPASYPESALEAQSICARTYACRNLKQAGLPEYGAHVDDSTAYQVYNNIGEQERTTGAVKATRGEVLCVGEETAETYYYSTSCGYGTDAGIWRKSGRKGTAGEEGTRDGDRTSYLRGKHIAPEKAAGEGADGGEKEKDEEGQTTDDASGYLPGELMQEAVFAEWIQKSGAMDYEKEEPWYRWTYTVKQIDAGELNRRLSKRQKEVPEQILVLQGEEFVKKEVSDLGQIKDIRVEKRREGGVIDALIIEGSQETVRVLSEYNVRFVLCDGQTKAVRQDGSEADVPTLLPSGFFLIEAGKEEGNVIGYKLIGGGFGHGVGMSQNGAACMAECGMDAEQILAFFYEGGQLYNLY